MNNNLIQAREAIAKARSYLQTHEFDQKAGKLKAALTGGNDRPTAVSKAQEWEEVCREFEYQSQIYTSEGKNMEHYDLDSVTFVDAAFFVTTPSKIKDLTQLVLKHFHTTRTLLRGLARASAENKGTIYKQAALLNKEFCAYMSQAAGFTVLVHMMSQEHPDAQKLSKLIMKVFEQQQFLKQSAKGNLRLRPVNRFNLV